MSETDDLAPAKPLAEALYRNVSADAPAGPPPKREDVAPLRELCEGKQGTYVSEENPNMGGAPPDFRGARALCMELLDSARDIRVMVRLAQAEANLNGAPGLHAALHLLDVWLRKDWEALHPGPHDDRLARRERAQAFAPLTSPALAASVEKARLFKGAGLDGDISLRDFLLASGRRTAAAGEVARPPEGLAEVIARAKAEATVIAAAAALSASSALLKAIETTLKGAPEFPAPRFDRLIQALDQLAGAVKPFAVAPGAAGDGAEDEAAAPGPAAAAAPIGAIASREAALALLDEVLGYYAVSARSSPLPLALLKLREMAGASYPEWVAALAASGPGYAALTFSGVDPAALDAFAPEPGAAAGAAGAGSGGAGPDWAGPLAEARAAAAALEAAVAVAAASVEGAAASGEGDATAGVAAPDADGDAAGTEDDGDAAETEARGDAAAAPDAIAEGAAARLAALASALDRLEAALRAAPAAAPGRPSGRIRDRAGVKAALTQIAAWFSTAEPAHPMAVCLTRANGLVEMGFMDTLTELAPKGGDTLSLSIAPKS